MLDAIRSRLTSSEAPSEPPVEQTVQVENNFSESSISSNGSDGERPNIFVQIGSVILGLIHRFITWLKSLLPGNSASETNARAALDSIDHRVEDISQKQAGKNFTISGGTSVEEQQKNYMKVKQRDGYVEVAEVVFQDKKHRLYGFRELIKNRIEEMNTEGKATTIVAFKPDIAWEETFTDLKKKFPEYKFGKKAMINSKGESREAVHIVKEGNT